MKAALSQFSIKEAMGHMQSKKEGRGKKPSRGLFKDEHGFKGLDIAMQQYFEVREEGKQRRKDKDGPSKLS